MRVLFMGTPDFAVPCLEAIIEEGHRVVAVVTQPDRPKGRGHKLTPPPVKVLALERGIPYYQPEKVKAADFVSRIKKINPDIIVVVAFGQLLSEEILSIPRYGCVNIHASLLPRYRGAAPIHWAVINGEKETGVTTMYMDAGLDTGDIILKETVAIDESDTVGIVHDKLAAAGARLIVETLSRIEAGTAPRLRQEEAQASYAPMLHKEDELIHWRRTAEEIYNQVRGMNPWPGAYTFFNNKILKIWGAEKIPADSGDQPGTVADIYPKKGFSVNCGSGQLLVTQVQLQGGKKMSAADFMHGNGIKKGIVLG